MGTLLSNSVYIADWTGYLLFLDHMLNKSLTDCMNKIYHIYKKNLVTLGNHHFLYTEFCPIVHGMCCLWLLIWNVKSTPDWMIPNFLKWLPRYFTCIDASDLFAVCWNVTVCSSSSRIMSAKLVDETDKSEVQLVASLHHGGLTGDVYSQLTKPSSTPSTVLCTADNPLLSTDIQVY